MFNMAGEVIGINTAIYSPTGGNVGIGFAIPSSYADNIIGQLRAAGRVKRGWLGVRIQQVTEEIAESLGLQGSKGAIVASVEGDTPASRAGVRANDVIVAFDGKPVNTSSELPLIVSETPIGRTVDLDIVRNGKPVRLRVTVAELPGGDPARLATREEPKQEREAPNESTAARQNLGITLTPLTDELRRRMGLERNDTGVVISSLNPASDAAAKGLRPGDIITEINGVAVRNPDQAAAEVDKVRAAKRNSVLLRVRRDRDFFVLGVRLMPLEEKPGQAR
jgi:serine protease Do